MPYTHIIRMQGQERYTHPRPQAWGPLKKNECSGPFFDPPKIERRLWCVTYTQRACPHNYSRRVNRLDSQEHVSQVIVLIHYTTSLEILEAFSRSSSLGVIVEVSSGIPSAGFPFTGATTTVGETGSISSSGVSFF